MLSTKENGRLRGRPLFCVLEPSVRPKRELLSHVPKRLHGKG
jgi:hypothetical protein